MARLPDPSLVTGLTVEPVDGDGLAYLHTTRGTVQPLTFAAGAAVTGVTARLHNVRTGQIEAEAAAGASDGALVAVALAGQAATVTLSGADLALGEVYQLEIGFVAGANDGWSRLLPVEVVA